MLRAALSVAAIAISTILGASGGQAQNRAQIGVLTCNVSGSIGLIVTSQESTACTFESQKGYREHYRGVIRKYGLDIGATGAGILTWAVFATGPAVPGLLAGHYAGPSAEATVGAGLGANILVGGSQQSVALQPLSVSGQTGLNLALGVSSFELSAAP